MCTLDWGEHKGICSITPGNSFAVLGITNLIATVGSGGGGDIAVVDDVVGAVAAAAAGTFPP